jgi:predicted peptidase
MLCCCDALRRLHFLDEIQLTDTRQQAASFSGRVTVDVSLHYLVYLPEGYGNDVRTWPLVLFLHGAGERGKNLDLVRKYGPPKLIDQGKSFPFILISPQCPNDEWWSLPALTGLLDEVERQFAVDKTREYVTGLSMGGFGTWKLAMLYPGRFAAIAPVCGGGDTTKVAALKSVPVWAFHGSKDPVVPLERSESLVRALKAAGGDVRLTVYPEAAHDSWTETYDNPEIYDWLLRHRLP